MAKGKTPAPRRAGNRDERELTVVVKLEKMHRTNPSRFAECMALLGDLVRESEGRARASRKI